MFVIFVANLQVPVNRAKGFTKTHKFATKFTHICDEFSEFFCDGFSKFFVFAVHKISFGIAPMAVVGLNDNSNPIV